MTLKNKINGIKEIWQFSNRWQILFNRLFFSAEKISIYRYKGLEILIDHAAGDSNGAREVLTSDMYRRYLKLMELGQVPLNILDFGANNGGFPLLLISEEKKIGKLVCVEFNPATFSKLRFNIERNLTSCRLIPLNVAVCGEKREINAVFEGGSTSQNIYQSNKDNGSGAVKIQGLTFNEIFESIFKNELVDICKMDVEGAEFEIFANGDCDQMRNCRYLLIEIHHERDRSRESVREKIKSLGFEETDPDSKSDELHYVHFFVNRRTLG